jgi:hypothetical protein
MTMTMSVSIYLAQDALESTPITIKNVARIEHRYEGVLFRYEKTGGVKEASTLFVPNGSLAYYETHERWEE